MEEFEQELRQAFERRPAPPSLKRRLMESGQARQPAATPCLHLAAAGRCHCSRRRAGRRSRLAEPEEQRKGEAARQEVMTALRITNHALNQMNAQLAAHGRARKE